MHKTPGENVVDLVIGNAGEWNGEKEGKGREGGHRLSM